MKPLIINIQPRGFCCGVASAMFMAIKTAKENKGKKIYMIGQMIHNSFANKSLEKHNIIALQNSNCNRATLIKNKIPENSIVIFSAHGSSMDAYYEAQKKNCKIIDTTCVYVKKTHDLINDEIECGFIVIFIGKANHPETEAVLSLNENKIHFVETVEDVQALNIPSDKIIVTNQTTLSIIDCQEVVEAIKKKYPTSIYKNEICDATYLRQKAILNLKDDAIDILFVIGDKASNNSNKLISIGKKIGIKYCLLVDEKTAFDKFTFINIKKIGITSGASTPYEQTKIVIDKIKNYFS